MKSLQKMKLSPIHRNWKLDNQSATSLSVNRLEAEEWEWCRWQAMAHATSRRNFAAESPLRFRLR